MVDRAWWVAKQCGIQEVELFLKTKRAEAAAPMGPPNNCEGAECTFVQQVCAEDGWVCDYCYLPINCGDAQLTCGACEFMTCDVCGAL